MNRYLVGPFLKQVSYLLFVSIGARAIRYFANIIVARSIEIEDFGIYTTFFQFVGYVTIILEIGLPATIIYFVVRQKTPTANYFAIALIIIPFLGIMIFGLMFFCNLIGIKFRISEFILTNAVYFLPYCFFLAFNNSLMAIVRALGKNWLFNASLLVSGSSLLVIFVIIHYAFGISTHNAWVGSIISLGITLSFNYAYLRRDHLRPLRFDYSLLKKSMPYGMKNFLYRLLSNLCQIMPFTLILLEEDKVLLGYMSAALLGMSVFRIVGQSISLLLTAKLSSLDIKTASNFNATICFLLAIGSSFGIGLFTFFGEDIIEFIYGEKYKGAHRICLYGVIWASLELIIGVSCRVFMTAEKAFFKPVFIVYSVIALSIIAIFYTQLLGLGYSLESSLCYSMLCANLVGITLSLYLTKYYRTQLSDSEA